MFLLRLRTKDLLVSLLLCRYALKINDSILADLDSCHPRNRFSLSIYSQSYSRSKEIISMFLQYGANVNSVGSEKKTAMHIAAREEHTYFIEVLLEKGADPNVRDANGCTPLMSAARCVLCVYIYIYYAVCVWHVWRDCRKRALLTPPSSILAFYCSAAKFYSMQFLLTYPIVDVCIKDKAGRTAYEILYESAVVGRSTEDVLQYVPLFQQFVLRGCEVPKLVYFGRTMAKRSVVLSIACTHH